VRNLGKSTAYPSAITIASSFDRDLSYKVGKALGCEARVKNVHLLLGPGMNIYRMSICGRNFEYLGEDPFLAGQLAKNYVMGLQDQGVMGSAKHYAANNYERNRNYCSSNLDERTLHEIYLPAFKACVQDAHVASVMTSYNLINGVQASENDYLINKILKQTWGYDGFAVSDWASTYHGVACAKGGLDLEMPKGVTMSKEILIPAIQKKELDPAVIDDKVRRILSVYQRFGFFENPILNKGYKLDSSFVRSVALDLAREGMVLLKNSNNALPLKKETIKSIAVLGPFGAGANTGGRGSSWTDPLYPLSFVDALKKVAPGIDVKSESGIFVGVPFPAGIFDQFDMYIKKDGKQVKGAMADYYLGKSLAGNIIHSEFVEKVSLENEQLWEHKVPRTTDFSVRFTCFYTPEESGYYSIAGCGDDGYRIILDGVEIVNMWQDQGPTNAKFDMFLNAHQEYKVVMEFYQAGGGALVKLGVKKVKMDVPPEMFADKALALAKTADVVIMPVGFSGVNEGEATDRTFEMPYDQAGFINKVAAVNPNVFVVVTSGGGIETASWLKNVKGLLMGWYPGQEGTLAAAEILFGITNPSGKLPITIENKLEENPWYKDYFTKDIANVNYSEGIFMGYRHWDRSVVKPAFPFGFGLSYTTFAYSQAATPKKAYKAGEPVVVSVTIKNTGARAGAEAVQLYVSDKESRLPRPVKELKDFARVQLNPGEEKTVKFELKKDAFMYFDPQKHDWILEPGAFDLLIGASSVDIKQTVTITID
jgi:beta-glucosidase